MEIPQRCKCRERLTKWNCQYPFRPFFACPSCLNPIPVSLRPFALYPNRKRNIRVMHSPPFENLWISMFVTRFALITMQTAWKKVLHWNIQYTHIQTCVLVEWQAITHPLTTHCRYRATIPCEVCHTPQCGLYSHPIYPLIHVYACNCVAVGVPFVLVYLALYMCSFVYIFVCVQNWRYSSYTLRHTSHRPMSVPQAREFAHGHPVLA